MATKGNIFKRSFNTLWQNPIIIKELRSRMRRRRSYTILTIFLTFSAAIVSLVYFGIASSNEFYPDPDVRRTLGQAIFITVVLLQLGAVNFITPAFTAGSISSERENQTYDLLRAAPVRAKDIVRGKLLSGLLFTLLLLIATIPMQSMAFLFGGIELPELLIATLMLIVTATTFSAIGVYASTLLKRSIPATVLAYAISNGGLIILPLIFGIVSALFPYAFDSLDFFDPEENLVGFFIFATILWLPIIAAFLSEALLLEEDVIFFWIQDINPTLTIYIPSPWMGFVLINLFIAWLFYRAAIRRVARREKQ
jgi:ABC-type transport system involved in multi-copper enzyme maturation permease subunit